MNCAERVFFVLSQLAGHEGITVKFKPLRAYKGMLYGDRIALSEEYMDNIGECDYNLAHELAHHFLHYDKGDILHIEESQRKVYEEQADRAARMLLKALTIAV